MEELLAALITIIFLICFFDEQIIAIIEAMRGI